MDSKNKSTEPQDEDSYQDSRSDGFPDPLTFNQPAQTVSPPPDGTTVPTPLAVAPSADVHTVASNPWETPPVSSTAVSDVPVEATPFAAPPVQFGSPKKSKKKLIVGAIIAGTLVVLAGSGALAYNFWYQNPGKVVTDSIINAINAKTVTYTGTLNVTGDTKVKIVISGNGKSDASSFDATATFSSGAADFTMKGSALYDSKHDLYIKVGNVDQVAALAAEFLPQETQILVDKLVAKLNDKWIKIEASEMEKWSEGSSKSQKCLTDAQEKFQSDSNARSEIIELYKDNQFIVIDKTLPSKDGSLGYLLKGDSKAAESFANGLKDTSIYKSLQSCDDSFTITKDDLKALTDTSSGEGGVVNTFELWVSRWSHEVTKFHVQSSDSSDTVTTLDLLPVFNKEVTIVTPKDPIDMGQLQKDIEAIMESFVPAYDDSTMELFDSTIVTPTT